MEIVESLEQLINDEFDVDLLQIVLVDDFVEVGGHELENQIDVPTRHRRMYFMKFNHGRVLNFFEDRDLSVSPLRVCIMLESLEYFFKCVDFPRPLHS